MLSHLLRCSGGAAPVLVSEHTARPQCLNSVLRPLSATTKWFIRAQSLATQIHLCTRNSNGSANSINSTIIGRSNRTKILFSCISGGSFWLSSLFVLIGHAIQNAPDNVISVSGFGTVFVGLDKDTLVIRCTNVFDAINLVGYRCFGGRGSGFGPWREG